MSDKNNTFEEIEIGGYKYRFYTKFTATQMWNFRTAYRNIAKKIIYASMLEMKELDSAYGYQMVPSDMAETWINHSGFEDLDFLGLICQWVATPLEFKVDDKGNTTDKPIMPLLDAVIEVGEDGIEILRLFFTGLTSPIRPMNMKQDSSTPSSKKAGRVRKTSSPKV